MTRQSHDQLAKQYLAELLTPLGKVETSFDVASEIRQVDVWFVPDSSPAANVPNLGLLNKIAASACVLEVFRNAPSPVEVRNCQLKLYALHGELLRQMRRQKQTYKEAELPLLWVLSPTFSEEFLSSFGAVSSPEWVKGVYLGVKAQKTVFVAINQLPVTEDTLWLRVLGRGVTQKRAVEELVALPKGNLLLENLLRILANWRKNVELNQNLSKEDRELIMNLSPAYLQQCEEWQQEGLQRGLQQARREMIENMLRVRFGTLDEELSKAIAPMLQLPTEELTRLLLTLNREDLLARFEGEF